MNSVGGSGSTRSKDIDLLVVEVDGVRCGFPAADVMELHAVVRTAPLPGAPDVIEGMIDVRGSLVAVLDLRARLGLARRPPLLSDHLVLVRAGPRLVALRVDRALDLVAIRSDTIESTAPWAESPHLKGVARLADGLLLVHDVESFLSAGEVRALDAALADVRSERSM